MNPAKKRDPDPTESGSTIHCASRMIVWPLLLCATSGVLAGRPSWGALRRGRAETSGGQTWNLVALLRYRARTMSVKEFTINVH